MTPIGYILLLGWPVIALMFFAALPPRRAAAVSFIAGWLFLPCATLQFAGFPDYTKASAASAGVLLGTLVFGLDRVLAFRPRWFDLPILVWCLVPFPSCLANGLTAYDGQSLAIGQITSWGLPYLIGRIYFGDLEGLRALAVGIALGGLVYVPFCLWESKMSPHLHVQLYGFDPSGFGEFLYGGYRPKVFLTVGLELGMWMTAASLSAYWLWSRRALTEVRGIPFGLLLPWLLGTTVLCRSTGALTLLLLGIAVALLLARTRRAVFLVALLVIAPLYIVSRANGLWSGDEALSVVRAVINERRAASLATRFFEENRLVQKAWQRPVFGWGGFGRNRIHDEYGNDITLSDGMWVITFGTYGLIGLTSYVSVLLLPVVLLPRRVPARDWSRPEVAAAPGLAVLLCLYAIDTLINAMHNPIYVVAAGGLTGLPHLISGPTRGRRHRGAEACERASRQKAAGRPEDAEATYRQALDSDPNPADDDLDALSDRADLYDGLGDLLTDSGRFAEAEATLARAAEARERAAAAAPDAPEPWRALAATRQSQGRLLTAAGRHPEAVEAWSRAVELLRDLADGSGEPARWRDLARGQGALGQALKRCGRDREAAEAGLAAEALWKSLATGMPRTPDDRKRWAESCNNLAWLLANAPDPTVREPSRAARFARIAVDLEPTRAAFWNTLGSAYVRLEDDKSALACLEKAARLDAGAAGFNDLFLALAHWRAGDEERAWADYQRALAGMSRYDPIPDDLSRLHHETAAMLGASPRALPPASLPAGPDPDHA